VDRYARRLRGRGIERVIDPGGPWVTNNMELILHQAWQERDAKAEHELRNRSGVRPFKP